MLFALAVGSLAGCAQAHQEGLSSRPDSGIHLGDSGNGGQDTGGGGKMDAPPHNDTPMGGQTQTLTQTTASTDTGVGLACGNTTFGYTSRNSYYRVFTLSDYGVTGTFHVTGIDFIVSAAAQSPSLTIGVGTYSGTAGGQTLTKTNIAITQTTMYTPTSTTSAVPVHVPIAADISGNLVVEIDQTTAGTTGTPYQFYIGANESGESKPGYVSSPDCTGLGTPTSMDAKAQQLSTPTHSNMVLTVTGSN